ncbi:TrmB family transcriptional regulator sugar-binding domain-containing protein [Streptomyces sp. 11x1]|uniref:TrmB family transcriptional regulator sugar-binding domain-containing protein n=1 Tax=Streptomyces sp. 11x1 TaxID=3038642 RepID=UPI00292FE89C|nr:TrmB family transcriptional regulator sugar-binding domain-containing protein [Streptomyces sp. 11x1]WNZ12013.1 TrmB family transcriptional regulator sugar-binding domain-containing protein [Streptomyces sp. 11x1]
MIVTIAVPVRAVTLTLVLGPEHGATTLEGLAARAVAADRRTVADLADLFTLPHRVMLDVVHGLWTKGYVSVDFSEGRLELTDTARDLIAQGSALASAGVQQEQRKFVYEPITGSVFTYASSLSSPPAGAIEVPVRQGIGTDDLPRGELLRAVRSVIRYDRRSRGLRQNVLDVSFGNPLLSTDGSMRWLSVRGTVHSDFDTGRLSVEISDDSEWNQQARDRFRNEIAVLAEQDPPHPFIDRLRGKAEPSRPARTDLAYLGSRLTRLADAAAATSATKLKLAHEELQTAARRLGERIDYLAGFRAAAEPVSVGEGVRWTRSDLIRSAHHQIVIAAPTIEYGQLKEILPDLEDALERGVTVVLLWGTAVNAALPDKVANALHDLKIRYGDQMIFGDRSARIRASLMVQDDEQACIGSRSLLTGDPGGCVLVQRAEGAAEPARCVVDLLIWARRFFPHWQTGRRIAFRPEDLGRNTGTEPAPAPVARGLPELPEEATRDSAAARIRWAADWRDTATRLTNAIEGLHTGVPVVLMAEDAEYQSLIHQALHSDARRIAVTDDDAEHEACGDALGRHLQAQLDDGATVHLFHPVPAGPATSEAFEQLTAAVRRTRTLRHGRATTRSVVCDRAVVVGSCSPLVRRSHRTDADMLSGHVGLQILSADFAARHTHELGIADWYGAPAEDAPTAPAQAAEDRAWADLEELLQAPESWVELRGQAVRTLLSRSQEEPQWQRWANWLVEDAWRRHAFVEAHLLAPLTAGTGPVSPELSTVAVPVEYGPTGDSLYYAALGLPARREERAVGLAGAIAELLLWGGPAGADVYAELSANATEVPLPAVWRELGERAVAYHEATGRALPLRQLASEAERTRRAEQVAQARHVLAQRVEDFRPARQTFAFRGGYYLHDQLFAADGLMTRIQAVAGAPGPGTADAYAELGSALPPGPDILLYLDEIVADGHHPAIQWTNYNLMRYADRAGGIVDNAREVVALMEELATTPDSSADTDGHHHEVTRLIRERWDELFREAEALGPLHAQPALALLHRLRPLNRAAGVE